MHIFRNLEIIIRVGETLLCQFTFPVFVVSALISHRIAGIGIPLDVIRDICNHKLGLGDVVPLEILKVIVI